MDWWERGRQTCCGEDYAVGIRCSKGWFHCLGYHRQHCGTEEPQFVGGDRTYENVVAHETLVSLRLHWAERITLVCLVSLK